MAYNTALDLESLVVNTKAATVYTAHENSLFLTGSMIPMVNLPAGSVTAQIPVMGSATAQKLGDLSGNTPANEDFDPLTLTDNPVTISADIYAARHVLRDLGGIDPAETGRVLGNSIQAAFDADVITAMNGFTASTSDSDPMNIDAMIDAVAQIRGTGEMGQLFGILSPAEAANLIKNAGTAAYAGGDFQTEGLRNGFIGTVAGLRCSNHLTSQVLTKVSYSAQTLCVLQCSKMLTLKFKDVHQQLVTISLLTYTQVLALLTLLVVLN